MKKIYIVCIKRKKRNSFCLARRSARNPAFLLLITGWGESGKLILQVSIGLAVFSGTVEKIFGQRRLSPLEKIGPYAYDYRRPITWRYFQAASAGCPPSACDVSS